MIHTVLKRALILGSMAVTIGVFWCDASALALGRVENPDSYWSKGVAGQTLPAEALGAPTFDQNVVMRNMAYGSARIDMILEVYDGGMPGFARGIITYSDGSVSGSNDYILATGDVNAFQSLGIAQSSSNVTLWNLHYNGVVYWPNVYWPYYDSNSKIKTQIDDFRNDSLYVEHGHFRSISRLSSSRIWQPQTQALFPNVYPMPAGGRTISFNPKFSEWIQR